MPGIKYVYTLVRDGDQIRFILDGADPGDNDGDGVEDRSGVWELCKNKQSAVQVAVGRRGAPGRPAATDEPYTDPWGTFMTGYAPFFDASGKQAGAVGVDMDAGVYLARIRTARNRALLGLLPAGLLIVGLSLAFYRIRLRGLAAIRDVARAGLEAESAAEVLATQRQRLRNVIEGTGVGTWEWNIETGVVLINDRWAAMIGYTPGRTRAGHRGLLEEPAAPRRPGTGDREARGEFRSHDQRLRDRLPHAPPRGPLGLDQLPRQRDRAHGRGQAAAHGRHPPGRHRPQG